MCIRDSLGGVAGSFLDLWGGEYEWDNWRVIHHQGRGHNTGVVIEYGKNLTQLEHDSDNTDVYTDMLPYAVQTAEDGTETVVTLPEVLLPIKMCIRDRITTDHFILCNEERFNIISVEDVKGRGMYTEVLAKKVVATSG